ncbi:MAG: hypothetical protein HRU29_00180 [Rhizobiales bacterium]|nr:hypothetical protein [Hyphomicrobiales bacterium]NRB12792.1 hypothetical protein [Hyphomicrobiales bacterium]
MKKLSLTIAFCLAVSSPVFAAQSSYTKLNFSTDCVFAVPESEEEAGMGATGICEIDNRPTIYYESGDLRESLGFGAAKPFETFSAWNSVNNVVEWRADDNGVIYAAIIRYFIDNPNPDTGMLDKASRGQVLVVNKVAQFADDSSCVVGMVDPRANINGNQMARDLADRDIDLFNCAEDMPMYFGVQGQYAADFSKSFGE